MKKHSPKKSAPAHPAPATGLREILHAFRSGLLSPSDATYRALAGQAPSASVSFRWLFAACALASLIQVVSLSVALWLSGLAGGQPVAAADLLLAFIVLPALMGFVLAASVRMDFSAVQWIATWMGGSGSQPQAAYALTATFAPFVVLLPVLGLISLLPVAGNGLSVGAQLILGAYLLQVQVRAVKAFNEIRIAQAALAVAIPKVLFILAAAAAYLFMVAPALPR